VVCGSRDRSADPSWILAFLASTLIEYFPAPIPVTPLTPKMQVEFLTTYPEPGAVYDTFAASLPKF
jgi:hypothetical protein